MADRFSPVAAMVGGAIAARAFPAAAIEVGRSAGLVWRDAFGTLTYEPDAAVTTPDTIFDLASLTKVIATTMLVMRASDAGHLSVDDRVADWIEGWRGSDREAVTIRDLLAHASGLTAYLPLFRNLTGRQEFERAICELPLEYAPRSRAIYSDLGFILLGFILEDAHVRANLGTRAPGTTDPSARLPVQFQRIASLLTSDPLAFGVNRALRALAAPTEIDPWRGRLLVGEVHDENAWALGGAAGHAGIFGTVAAVGAFARATLMTIAGDPILAAPGTIGQYIRRGAVPGSSRALGWDTMLPTSSCGTRLSPTAIGHTGFTGTSLWIDWERDFYVVFLTNRVHPSRTNEAIRQVRPRVHDAVVAALEDLGL